MILQDDLPPPACLLPPDPNAHPSKDNRVKVPSGKLSTKVCIF